MSIFREFNISMIPGKPPLIIHVSQYESDFVYTFNLVSGKSVLAIPDTAIAVIRGTKRDGNGYSKEASLDAENNKVAVIGEAQMTACAGRNVFELAIINDEKVICTSNFILDVERAPLDAGTIQSESVLRELQAIINSAEISTQAAEEASASAAEAVESAKALVSLPIYRYAGEIAETGDGFVSNAGIVTAHSNYKYAKYNLHDGAQKITVDSMYVTGSASNYAAFAFFAEENVLVSTVNNKVINTTSVGNTFTNVEVDVPLGANYVLVTFGNMGSSTTFATITETGLYKPATNKRVFNNGLNNVNKQFFYFHTTALELGSYTSLAFNAKFKTVSPVLSYEVYFTGYDADYTNRTFAIYKTGLTKGIDGNTVTIAENFQDTANSLSDKTYIGVVVNFLYAYSSESGARTGISNANLYAVTSDYCLLNDTELELAHYPASGFTTLSTVYADHYNPLYGGFLCTIGDSLTAAYYKSEAESWTALIAKWNNMQYENKGVSGMPLARNTSYTERCMCDVVDGLSATKFYTHIMVMGGANDYNAHTVIGENTDTEVTTFKGAVNHIIATLTQKFPNAHIVFGTTYRRNQAYADKPYADAMMEVCKLHSIPCLNNYENSGVQFFDENWMAVYGATNALGNNHLNAAGDLFVAPRFEHALKYGVL